jgi:hypothetical protein
MYLKMTSGKRVVAKFEGGIAHFDDFAKCVRSKLPAGIQAETVGKASFQ